MQINQTKFAAIVEAAKAKTNDRRWLAAIDKAAAGVESGWWITTELADCIAVTTETGNTYFANGSCQCKAFANGQPCKHRALARLLDIYNETEGEMKGVVYLIHFNRAYKHARHYLGYSEQLDKRITDHLCGMVARLMEVITNAGIEWKVSRTWLGDRKLERRLKNAHNAPLLCPVCNPKALNRAKEKAL